MTADEIMQMPAGREMDALVAVKLMGGFTVHGDNPWSGPPPYSTDIAAAWQVVERLIHLGYCPALIYDDNGHWSLVSDGWQTAPLSPEAHDIVTTFVITKDSWSDTAQLAICRAALLTVREANP